MRFISPKAHSIIGLLVGIALIFAPQIFRFSDVGGAAVTVPRVIGVIVILSELTMRGNILWRGMVPIKMHLMGDILLGLILALSPWLWSFSDEKANAWVPHLIVGIALIGSSLMTRNTLTRTEERE
jgi:hypothetical protein